MQIKNTLGQNVLADIKCLTYVRKKFYARHVLATAFFIGKPDLMRKPFSSIGNEIQHCAGTEGNDRGKHGMVRQHFEGTALKEIDNLGQNGSVPHSDDTRMEERPAEVAAAKCKGGEFN